jgi:hypothetical protein
MKLTIFFVAADTNGERRGSGSGQHPDRAADHRAQRRDPTDSHPADKPTAAAHPSADDRWDWLLSLVCR